MSELGMDRELQNWVDHHGIEIREGRGITGMTRMLGKDDQGKESLALDLHGNQSDAYATVVVSETGETTVSILPGGGGEKTETHHELKSKPELEEVLNQVVLAL